MLVEHPEEGEDEGEAVVVVTVVVGLAPVQGGGLLQTEVPVLPPVGVLHHVGHGGVGLGQADHQALLPMLAPVPPQSGLIKLHDLALAVRDGDVKVALVVVILQETACNTTRPMTFSLFSLTQLTLARLDNDGGGVVPGPHEGCGQGEGRDVQETGEKLCLTHRAPPGETSQAEALLAVGETEQLKGKRLWL